MIEAETWISLACPDARWYWKSNKENCANETLEEFKVSPCVETGVDFFGSLDWPPHTRSRLGPMLRIRHFPYFPLTDHSTSCFAEMDSCSNDHAPHKWPRMTNRLAIWCFPTALGIGS